MPELQSKFREVWDELSVKPLPRRFRKVHEIGYSDFRRMVLTQEAIFVQSIPRSLYEGDAYFIRGAFPKSFMDDLKLRVVEYWKRNPSSFHKMVEGCPDFHRTIDEEAAKKYSIKGIKHSCYFYPWNDDPLAIFNPIWERWSLCKFLSGLRLNEFEKNTPKDGVVDRIQIIRYPSGAGMLETHSDPYLHQRLIVSGFMSKRGEDFETGGFYMVGPSDEIIHMEDDIEVGDMLIAYATVLHGVDTIDQHKKVDWDSTEGRWFLSMYSNASDEVKDRHTGFAVQL